MYRHSKGNKKYEQIISRDGCITEEMKGGVTGSGAYAKYCLGNTE